MINSISSEYAFVGALYSLAEDHGQASAIKHVLNLDKSDFTDSLAGDLFNEIKKKVIDDQPFDVLVLSTGLNSIYGQDYGLFSEIGRLVRGNSSYAAIESHKSAVLRSSQRRKIKAALIEAQREIELEHDILKSLGKLESTVEKLMGMAANNQSGFVHLGDLMMDWVNTADEIIAGKQQEPGFTTGLNALDEHLGEKLILPGSLFVIGANPSAGKTALMVKMAEGMAFKNPHDQVLIYSLEMPNNQIAERFAGLSTDNTNPKYFDDVHWGKLSGALELYKGSNIYCCDNSVVSVSTIKSDCRERAQKGKISCIMVDYLTLMEMPKKDRNDLSVGEVTKQLKRLAKELGCVVILLCQLSRDNMKRANKRPIKSDLRESGQIEQDADYILFPYRDLQFNPESFAGNFCELILDKNRHGATGTVYAQFRSGVWHDCDQAQGSHHCKESAR